jgi:Uma2 family endonuclease
MKTLVEATTMPIKTLMSAEEFANTGPETDGWELVRGELVQIPPTKGRHGETCGNVVFLLKAYKKTRGKGCVLSNDVGVITETDPDTVRGADILFFLNPSWTGPAPNRYFDEPASLAVEVRSEGQPWNDLTTKMDEYLGMGVPMGWIGDPANERLTVYEPNRDPTAFAATSEFDGGEALPGLHFKVAELFEC